MKRVVPFVLVLVLACAPAFSQGISMGVKGGLGYSTFLGQDYSDMLDDYDETRGFYLPFGGGVFVTIGINEMFALEPEVLFLHLGAAETGTFSGSETYTITMFTNYIAPSVLVKARFGMFNVFAGPTFLFKVSDGTSDIETSEGTYSASSDFAADDLTNILFAATLGGGVEYPLGPGSLVGELRGTYSFTSFVNGDVYSNSDYKPFALMLMVGYSYPIN